MDTSLVHGQRWSYTKHGCRCDECRAANTDYHRELRARKRAGERVTRLINATMAREHIVTLHDEGYSYREIARRSGLAFNTILKIRDGQVRADFANVVAILDVIA